MPTCRGCLYALASGHMPNDNGRAYELFGPLPVANYQSPVLWRMSWNSSTTAIPNLFGESNTHWRRSSRGQEWLPSSSVKDSNRSTDREKAYLCCRLLPAGCSGKRGHRSTCKDESPCWMWRGWLSGERGLERREQVSLNVPYLQRNRIYIRVLCSEC